MSKVEKEQHIVSLLGNKDNRGLMRLYHEHELSVEFLLSLFYGEDSRLHQRVASFMADHLLTHPNWLSLHLSTLIQNLNTDDRVSVRRNTLRLLQHGFVLALASEDDMGLLTDLCFTYLNDHQEPIAVKVFAMSILLYAVKRYPELAPELRTLIEFQLPYGSAGFKSRGKKVLKALQKIQDRI